MNQYKRSEVALYITFGAFLIAVGALSEDYILYSKMIGVFAGVTASMFLFYKLTSLALKKLFPEKQNTNTVTIGGIECHTINFDCNEKRYSKENS